MGMPGEKHLSAPCSDVAALASHDHPVLEVALALVDEPVTAWDEYRLIPCVGGFLDGRALTLRRRDCRMEFTVTELGVVRGVYRLVNYDGLRYEWRDAAQTAQTLKEAA